MLADDNPAVRMQVVDLLVSHRDDSMVGVLQNWCRRKTQLCAPEVREGAEGP